MYSIARVIALIALFTVARAHIVITYPGWRGNNLQRNGTAPEDNPESVGIDYEAGDDNKPVYPWGMQWMFPCGGLPQSTNRTNWPVGGGALAFQPGWFPGHARARIHINMGIQQPGDLAPPNMSHPLMPAFGITGPSNDEYHDGVCFPQIPLAKEFGFEVGDNITLQVVEHTQHGAALYSCVDVTLTEPEDVEEVTPSNCYNSTAMGFERVFTTALDDESGASSVFSRPSTNLIAFMATLAAIGLM